jgi:hypothetical protein
MFAPNKVRINRNTRTIEDWTCWLVEIASSMMPTLVLPAAARFTAMRNADFMLCMFFGVFCLPATCVWIYGKQSASYRDKDQDQK